MAKLSNSFKDFLPLYRGFDQKLAGLGTIDPTIYADKRYAKKKTSMILIGGINEIIYSGYENDKNPKVLVMGFEPIYNTIIGINMNYAPQQIRHAIIKYTFMSNKLRIKQQKPLMIDYPNMLKAIPQIGGMVRRYKLQGIRVTENYPLNEWYKETQGKSSWQGMYKNRKAGHKQITTRDYVFTRTRPHR